MRDYFCLNEAVLGNDFVSSKNAYAVSAERKASGKERLSFVNLNKSLAFDSEYKNEVMGVVAAELKYMLRCYKVTKKDLVLVVGVGNEGMTADALGGRTLKYLDITEHLKKAGVKSASRGRLCGIRGGVAGVTGINSFDVVKGVVDRIKPASVIAVDTLSAGRASRLMRVIQISDGGLVPGSGVGNAKRELSEKSLGVPVIAVGVPLVIQALNIWAEGADGKRLNKATEEILSDLVVTVKEIDLAVEDFSEVIGEAINLAVHGTS